MHWRSPQTPLLSKNLRSMMLTTKKREESDLRQPPHHHAHFISYVTEPQTEGGARSETLGGGSKP